MRISLRTDLISLYLALAACLFSPLRLMAQDPATPINVWTWHNDIGRTGQNLSETTLKLTNVNKASFAGVDLMYSATQFSVPTIANGFVYIGTQSDNVTNVGKGTFYIFGKLATQRTSC